jgi:hypothetical protein
MGHLRRVAGIVLSAIEDHPNLVVSRERLSQMRVQVRLTASNDNQPPPGGMSVGMLSARILHGFHSFRILMEQVEGQEDHVLLNQADTP